MKIQKDTLPLIYPNPIVLVTSMDDENRTNIITITLVGAACGKPPIIGIGVGRQSHSCDLIQGSREFVVNIPNVEMISDVEYCGLVSGREVEKTSKTSFTLTASAKVRPPMIAECPVNLECRVVEALPLGSSMLFLGEVLALHVEEEMLDEKGGVDLAKAQPILFNLTNSYWSIGEKLEDYGFSRSR